MIIMSTTTTTTTQPNSSNYDHHQHQYSAHHQFPHFSIDLNQDHHHHHHQQQQQYLQHAAAHFFSTGSGCGNTSMVLDYQQQLPATAEAAASLVPSSPSLPYRIFMDVEDPDAAAAPLSCRNMADYSWGPPPSFLPQHQQQKANDIYGGGSSSVGVVAKEKSGSDDDQMVVEANWMPCTTSKVRTVKNNYKKLTIKTNASSATLNSDHGHGRPKKYSSSASSPPSAAAAWDPQKMNNDMSPSTFEQQQQQPATDHHNNSPLSSSGGDSSSSPTVVLRVCADCNTTKTPLWRSGPRGPKSLCNACGIRQRKARRAMAAAAAAAEGADLAGQAVPVPPPAATTIKVKTAGGQKGKNANKHKLGASSNSHLPFKKRCKFTAGQPRGRKSTTNTSIGSKGSTTASNGKLCLEELVGILSKSASAFQRVFPHEEKEAAILLMALSYGLVQS